MNKSGKTNRNISFMLFIFYCSLLVLTLGHYQEKIFHEEKVLESFLKEMICSKRSNRMNRLYSILIHWIKIILWYPSVFNWPLYDLSYCRLLALSSLFEIYLLSISKLFFKLAITVLVRYLSLCLFRCLCVNPKLFILFQRSVLEIV